ncbi:MAG: hypothetical protein A2W00_04665 [Candidatus Eisenbacteria bacterium RBG_16_71_46]|nr:MAG: hypothetical protein A2W00_04665 [Candidatus Eisenbacteria bacterium RBG_16_71_46]
MARLLLAALMLRDPETALHGRRVARVALRIELVLSERMRPLPFPLDRVSLRTGAVLHDIGKVGIDLEILQKPDTLTEAERAAIRRHPRLGYEMCAPYEELRAVLEIIRHHHERWDGAGYPDRLTGHAIPLPARVVSVADAFDALTSERPYRAAQSAARARRIVEGEAGAQLDPDVIEAFLAVPVLEWEALRCLPDG